MHKYKFLSVNERMQRHLNVAEFLPLGFNSVRMRFTTSAVSTASSAPQHRQDYQYSSSVRGLLKNVYLPALNNTVFRATPLLEMFGTFGGKIDFAGNKIIKGFKSQRAGGFGGIPEGGSFVTNIKQTGFQGAERIKYLNAYFSLTGPAAASVRSGEGSFVDAISDGMKDTLETARCHMERIIGGCGNGLVATVTNDSTWNAGASTASVCTGVAGTGGYSMLQFLTEGARVDICQDASGTLHVGSGAQQSSMKGAVVTAVDYENGTCNITPTATITIATGSTLYLTLENAYGDIETDGTVTANSCLEPHGLYDLVDTTSYTSWGLTRATYPHALNSIVKAAASEELDEELLIGWILDLVNYKQSTPNVLVTDPRSRLNYFSNRKEDRRFDMKVMDSMFGFRSIGVVIDNYSLVLQSLSSLTPGTLFMLNTGAFKFAQASNGFQWIEDGNGPMRNKEESDALFASAMSYMNFVCEDPKGQLKATGISYS